jgi:phage terminase small subunit
MMPTRAVSAKTMAVGKKGGGKHWTKKQIEQREQASVVFERSDGTGIEAPIWISAEGRKIWDKKIAEIRGLKGSSELLDALDSEILALFCDAVALYKRISNKRRLTIDDHKIMQTYMLRIKGYSELLGFTPGARARLIKRRSDDPQGGEKDKFGQEFD